MRKAFFVALLSSLGLVGCTDTCTIDSAQKVLQGLKNSAGLVVLETKKVDNSEFCQVVARTPDNMKIQFFTSGKYVIEEILDTETGLPVKDRELVWKYQTIGKEEVKSLLSYASIILGTGPKNIIVIGDPECPYCEKLLNTFTPEMLKEYTINYVMFPLQNHAIGQLAAYQSACTETGKTLRASIKTPAEMTKLIEHAKEYLKNSGNTLPQTDNCDEVKRVFFGTTGILQKNGIAISTPILITSDGRWELGALPPEMLKKFLK